MTTDRDFENEVRRVARALWPSGAPGGATYVGSREVDGLFETDDQIHFLECTTSRRKDKAEQDGQKLKRAVEHAAKRNPYYAVRGWFITQHEPTVDQRAAITRLRNRAIVAMSFDQFRAKLVKAPDY